MGEVKAEQADVGVQEALCPVLRRRDVVAELILQACGCGLLDIAKVNVYLTDMATFAEMNDAYLSVFGSDPAARITVGCSGLALGAAVEMDCIAFLPGT